MCVCVCVCVCVYMYDIYGDCHVLCILLCVCICMCAVTHVVGDEDTNCLRYAASQKAEPFTKSCSFHYI